MCVRVCAGIAFKVVLTPKEMLAVHERMGKRIVQYNARLALETDKEPAALVVGSRHAAIAMWYPSGNCETHLSDNNREGLRSLVVVGKVEVFLACYTRPANLPMGVKVLEPILGRDEFHRLAALKRNEIAVVCDLVRFLEVDKALSGDFQYAWFVDLDNFWLVDLKSIHMPISAFGHVVATIPARKTMHGGKRALYRHWMTKFHHMPFDFRYASTPIRFTCQSPLLAELIVELRSILEAGGCEYNACMRLIPQKVAALGLIDAYVDTGRFCPVSPYCGLQVVRLAARKGFNLQELQKSAWAVRSDWQSGKGSAQTMFERGSHKHIVVGSFWDNMLKWARGKFPQLTDVELSADPEKKRRVTSKSAPDYLLPALPWPMPPSLAVLPRTSAVYPDWESSHVRSQVELVRRLGSGTYGVTYLGRYRESEMGCVAVKVQFSSRIHCPVDPCELAFSTMLAGSSHVVRVQDFFYSPWLLVIVMELLDGDLFHLTRATPNKSVGLAASKKIMHFVALGVQFMHNVGIIHRDLHAANVLLRGSFQAGRDINEEDIQFAKICDFGAAADVRVAKEAEKFTALRGALACRPPEIVFRRGLSWGLLDLKPTNTVQKAVYGKPVDAWALGSLYAGLLERRDYFFDCTSVAKHAASLTLRLGKIPREVARDEGWSVPEALIKHCRGDMICSEVRRVAAHSANLLAYSPKSRATAVAAATHFASPPSPRTLIGLRLAG